MVQQAPGNGGGVPPAGQPPASLDQLNQSIADKDKELKQAQKDADRAIKQLQQDLADLNARKSARAAFEQEQTTGDKALQTAQDKVAAANEKADELKGEAEKLAGMLSDQQQQGIPDIVDASDGNLAGLRTALEDAIANVVKASKEETDAKAASAKAKIDAAETKRQLTARTQAIDQASTRITTLVADAQNAIKQGQIPTAYLLLTDLERARDALDKLNDDVALNGLRQTAAAAWDAEQAAGIKERAATWTLTQAKDVQLSAQTDLTTAEANRRADLKKALDELGNDGGDGKGGGQARPGAQGAGGNAPAAQAVFAADERREFARDDEGGAVNF